MSKQPERQARVGGASKEGPTAERSKSRSRHHSEHGHTLLNSKRTLHATLWVQHCSVDIKAGSGTYLRRAPFPSLRDLFAALVCSDSCQRLFHRGTEGCCGLGSEQRRFRFILTAARIGRRYHTGTGTCCCAFSPSGPRQRASRTQQRRLHLRLSARQGNGSLLRGDEHISVTLLCRDVAQAIFGNRRPEWYDE